MLRSQIARRWSARSTLASAPTVIRRAFTTGIFLGPLILLLHVVPGVVNPTYAQGSRKDGIVFNSRGIPLAGATVRVCTMPASGQPCAPLAQIYSDAALTQAIANPTTTDGLGNYFFYAAPGRYEIEISGPGITTKQTPDVILSSDPSSPTFNNLSTTGNINAFSLNLTGNLTVNGNTSVVGNLASGTLNLTNQSTPPGAASAGTVDLYTKSDKRLYYKDDTGTEIGPIAASSGAQTNVSNTFTAPQNFDSDFHTKGPNPVVDLTRYGGYASTSPIPQTTGSITSGSAILTLASAQDFANGQGVVVYGAGATPTISTPPIPTVTPTGILNGSTTYSYKIIAEDYYGGLTAASSAGTTTSGAASLGVTTITLSSGSISNGTVTYTSTVNHNLQNGTTVSICQFGGGSGCPGTYFDEFNGIKTINSVPSGTTFTTAAPYGYANSSESTGSPYLQALACNTLTFSGYSGAGTLRYWIYRSKNSGAYSLVGVAVGVDPFFVDCGVTVPTAPSYVPATPPSSAQAGYLATTIASGGGSTSLTLAAAATTTVSSATVLHDNTPAMRAAIQAAFNYEAATVYIPAPTVAGAVYPFNSTLDMTSGFSNSSGQALHILINGWLTFNQPWAVRAYSDIEGTPKSTPSYDFVEGAYITGTAQPMFLVNTSVAAAVHFNRLDIGLYSDQQTGIYTDSGPSGGGAVGLTFDDVDIQGYQGLARPYVLKGGYDYHFYRGVCDANGAQTLISPPCVELTDSSPAVVTSSGTAQIPGRAFFRGTYFIGTGVEIDSIPNPNPAATSDYSFDDNLAESFLGPFLHVYGGNDIDQLNFDDFVDADRGAAAATPIIDAAFSGLRSVTWKNGALTNSGIPLLLGGTSLAVEHPSTLNDLLSNTNWFNIGQGYAELNNESFGIFNGGNIVYRLATPTTPTATVNSGGNVPLGTHTYTITAADTAGRETLPSPGVTATATSGNQAIAITAPAFGVGTSGWYIYRDGARVGYGGSNCNTPIPASTTTFTDGAGNIYCGQSQPGVAAAGASSMDANGISSWKYLLNGNTLAAPAGASNQTWTFADHGTQYFPATAKPSSNIGFTVETGIPQSAFDNFNRANGAIGSNWTVQTGGFNVSGNALAGTNSTNNWAYYSAPSAAFAADQFAEITLPAPVPSGGGAGPAVRMSGTGGSADNYNCHPNNTTLYLERILNGSSAILSSVANTSAAGDVIRLEAVGNTINCYYNGVLKLAATDSNLNGGTPGLELYGTSATLDNWTGGNLIPLAHTSAEQDFSQVQHFPMGITVGPLSLASAPPTGITMGGESFNSVPRAFLSTFLPGALTSTWTGSTVTLDKAITVTRLQVQAKTAPSGCSTNAVIRLTDGTTPVNVTVSAAANDSGAVAQNYAAAANLSVSVQTAAAGCTTSPADANVIVQYKMQ
jgi:hypothetical protein